MPYLWPRGEIDMKVRVTLAIILLAAAKAATVGIPLLGFFGEGRSLSDWISDSKTELI